MLFHPCLSFATCHHWLQRDSEEGQHGRPGHPHQLPQNRWATLGWQISPRCYLGSMGRLCTLRRRSQRNLLVHFQPTAVTARVAALAMSAAAPMPCLCPRTNLCPQARLHVVRQRRVQWRRTCVPVSCATRWCVRLGAVSLLAADGWGRHRPVSLLAADGWGSTRPAMLLLQRAGECVAAAVIVSASVAAGSRITTSCHPPCACAGAPRGGRLFGLLPGQRHAGRHHQRQPVAGEAGGGAGRGAAVVAAAWS